MFETIDQAVSAYVSMRDSLREFQRDFKAEEKRMKDEMEKISMWLRDRADELGVNSFKTDFGTAYRKKNTHYNVKSGEWGDFLKWAKETDNLHCIQKRVTKTAIEEIYNGTGELPPGIAVYTEIDFGVRRA